MNNITDADVTIFEAIKVNNLSLEQFKDWLQQRLAESNDEGWNRGWDEGNQSGYDRGFDDGRG